MHPGLRDALLTLDDRLQWAVPLKVPVFTADANVLDGNGVYSAEDWGRTRRLGSAQHGIDGRQYESDERYLRYIHEVEPRKVAAAESLANAWDFGRYRRIFELGCGDMIQAYVVASRFRGEDVEYVASDFDRYVIDRCATLPILSRLSKRVFNVLEDSHDAFAGSDLLVSWGLDAALDDRQLTTLLASARRLRVPYLMCSPTTVGPFTWIHHLATSAGRRRLIDAKQLRMHGWARSLGCFTRLAREAGTTVRDVGRHGIYRCMLFDAGLH